MAGERLLRSAGLSAYLSGVVVLAGILLLFAMPQREPYETLTLATSIVFSLSLLPVALAFDSLGRTRAPGAGRLALVLGATGMLVAATVQMLVLLRVVSFAQRERPTLAALALIGCWLILSGELAGLAVAPRPLVLLSDAIGAIFVLTSLAVFLGAVPTGTVAPSQATPLTIVVGVLVSLATYVAYPTWAILVGRRLRGRGLRAL